MTKLYSYFNSLLNYLFFEEPTQMQIDLREQEFHNMVREYVVFLLIFISLYGISYILIYIYRKKREEIYANEEDALVYRISFWMCTFALAVSIGSAFLLPFSIITNELLLYYPQNYYMQWLNDCFSGSSRGIMSRVNETIVLILLLMVIILGITYLLCCTLGYSELALTNLLTIWHYLPLLYSCISFFGVILLLICTPIGFAILFTVLGDLIVKPQFLRDIQVEYEVALLEEMHLRAKFERKKSENIAIDDCNCPTHCNQKSIYKKPDNEKNKSILEYCKSQSLPSFTSFLNDFSSNRLAFNNSFDIDSSSNDNLHKSNNLSEIKDQLLNETVNNCSIAHLNCIRKRNQMNENHLKTDLKSDDNFIDKTDLTDENKNNSKLEDILKELNNAEMKRKNLQTLKRASALRRNIGYPLAIILLLCLTLLSIGMVLKNILELLIGIKALPISSATHRFSLGIASLYKLGYFGAVLEIFLILYLWNTSLVGLYSLPLLERIKPQKNNTSFTKIIINCSLLLVLSSALPVLARTIGITNFDLLGDFGKINWLGNFYVVSFYNILFVSFSTFTLAKKFTILMHKELFRRLINLWILHLNSLSRSGTPNQITSSTIVKNSTKQNGNLNSSLNTD